MSETQPTTDSPTPAQTAPENPSRKGCMIAGSVLFVIVAGFVGFVIWAGRERMHSQSSSRLLHMSIAIGAYFDEHESLPPMIPMKDVVTDPKHLRLFEGTNIFTAQLGTEPVLRDFLSGLPIAYYTDGKGYIVYIPGRDGDYDITDPAKIFEGGIAKNNPKLLRLTQKDFKATEGDKVWVHDENDLLAQLDRDPL